MASCTKWIDLMYEASLIYELRNMLSTKIRTYMKLKIIKIIFFTGSILFFSFTALFLYYSVDMCGLEHPFNSTLKKAKTGDCDAQEQMGRCYFRVANTGPDQYFNYGIKWYKQAVSQGCTNAQTALAWVHIQGEILEIDYKKAEFLFKTAAINGDISGNVGLVALYSYFANNSFKDDIEAYAWLYSICHHHKEMCLSPHMSLKNLGSKLSEKQILKAKSMGKQYSKFYKIRTN